MCRMWGLHDSSKFSIEMVPLMEAACNIEIMDWGTILSVKLATAILEFRNKSRVTDRFIPPFYFSAYILDTLCFNFESCVRVEMDSTGRYAYSYLPPEIMESSL